MPRKRCCFIKKMIKPEIKQKKKRDRHSPPLLVVIEPGPAFLQDDTGTRSCVHGRQKPYTSSCGAVAVDDAVFLGPLVFRFAPAGRGFLSPELQPVIHHLVKLLLGHFGFLFDDKKVRSTISDNFRIRQDVRFSCTILPFATAPGCCWYFPLWCISML